MTASPGTPATPRTSARSRSCWPIPAPRAAPSDAGHRLPRGRLHQRLLRQSAHPLVGWQPANLGHRLRQLPAAPTSADGGFALFGCIVELPGDTVSGEPSVSVNLNAGLALVGAGASCSSGYNYLFPNSDAGVPIGELFSSTPSPTPVPPCPSIELSCVCVASPDRKPPDAAQRLHHQPHPRRVAAVGDGRDHRARRRLPWRRHAHSQSGQRLRRDLLRQSTVGRAGGGPEAQSARVLLERQRRRGAGPHRHRSERHVRFVRASGCLVAHQHQLLRLQAAGDGGELGFGPESSVIALDIKGPGVIWVPLSPEGP